MPISFFITSYTLPPDKLAKAIEYARARNRLYFIAAVYGFLVLAGDPLLEARAAISRLGGDDHAAQDSCRRISSRPLLLLTMDLLELPIAMRYHQLAVRYEQSIQPWGLVHRLGKWGGDRAWPWPGSWCGCCIW